MQDDPSQANPVDLVSPVFVVSAPRSGMMVLREALDDAPDLWSADSGARDVCDALDRLHPKTRGWSSSRLDATDVSPEDTIGIASALLARARDRDDRRPITGARTRLLDTSALHGVRVDFLAAAFPSAQFIYLYRRPEEAVASAAEAWVTGRFASYDPPGWDPTGWSFGLVEGWRELAGMSVRGLAAAQWEWYTSELLSSLERLDAERWAVVHFDELLNDPQREVERLCRFLGIGWDRELVTPLPLSGGAISPPLAGKWTSDLQLPAVIEPLRDLAATAESLFAEPSSGLKITPPRRSPQASAEQPAVEHQIVASVATPAVSALLAKAGASLVVSTYHSGQLLIFSADHGRLNSIARRMNAPMGVALRSDRLAVGTKGRVEIYAHHPQVAVAHAPHDQYFLPLVTHVTGDIRIHDLAWVGSRLWAVNTAFSCLVTIEHDCSFAPRWAPPFISELQPEDRCHLNGMAIVDNQVRYVTVLGETDTPGGWRDGKVDGGAVIDVATGEIVTRGLSMPHSPRWYDHRLWVLESGTGSLCVVDETSGAVTPVAKVPGFARGLTFWKQFAFIGLSQVRDTVFRALPIQRSDQPLRSGVWVVDITNGLTAGYIDLVGAVRELFDVQLMSARAPQIQTVSDTAGRAFLMKDTLRMG